MTGLTLLLAVKAGVTLFTVALPFLLLPRRHIDRLADFGQPDLAFYRLYGMAILALIVAYTGGLVQTLSGVYPTPIVFMGLVSNAGATVVLFATGRARKTPVFTAFFALIALGFALTAGNPALMMAPL